MSVTAFPPTAPLIVLGAPLSGTDRVAALLRQAGFFLGNDRNRFEESHFFLDQSRWVLRCAHAEWDVPEPLSWVFEDEETTQALTEALRARVEAKGIRGFLGWKTHLRVRSLTGFTDPWGWADTLACFTLPLWLRVFPSARVVHVVRNGVDVALDLAGREAERRAQLRSRARSSRCLDPLRAFEVWSAYVAAANAATGQIARERCLHLHCEDLAHRPEELLLELTEFARIELEPEQREEALAGLDPLPVDAFLESPEGRALHRRCKEHSLMKAYSKAAS